HVEDLLAVLYGDHAAVREAVTVEAAIDLVHDRRVAVAAPQEISMQRVHHAPIDRGGGRAQRLAEHLAAKHLGRPAVAALAAEQIHLQLLELEQLQEIGETLVHFPAAASSAEDELAVHQGAMAGESAQVAVVAALLQDRRREGDAG